MAVSKTLKVQKSTGQVEIPLDSHIGLLKGVIHLGTQKNDFQGVVQYVDQLLLQFELQDVLSEQGKAATVSKVVRNSMHPKATLPKIGAALGANVEEGVDFDTLIGKPVMVNMGQNQAKTKVVVKSFSQLPAMLRKEVKPLMGTPTILLDVEEITEAQKAELAPWVAKIISERVLNVPTSASNEVDDEDLV